MTIRLQYRLNGCIKNFAKFSIEDFETLKFTAIESFEKLNY